MLVAPVIQLVTSKPSDVGTWVRILAQSHELAFSLTSCPTRGERLYRGYTKLDFMVYEGKGGLNPSRDKNLRQAPQKEGGEGKNSYVAFVLCDRGWCVLLPYSTINITSVCVCFLPIYSGHQVRWTYRVTQEEGRTGFLIHLLSAVRALIFLARRIQLFLSLVLTISILQVLILIVLTTYYRVP